MTKHNKNKNLINTSKALVPYGSYLGSTVGSPRFTALERKSIKIPNSYIPIFIGIIISDASLSKPNKGDARLQFKQSFKHIEYFYSGPALFSFFKGNRGFYEIKSLLF